MKRRKKQEVDLLELGICGLELVRVHCGLTHDEFIKYMNDNNVWEIMNSDIDLWTLMCGGIEEAVLLFGRWMSRKQQEDTVNNYYKSLGIPRHERGDLWTI